MPMRNGWSSTRKSEFAGNLVLRVNLAAPVVRLFI